MSDTDAMQRAWDILHKVAPGRTFRQIVQRLPDALQDIPVEPACDDCGCRLVTGIERSERLCYTCARERAGR